MTINAITAVIVDDEPLARERLRWLLDRLPDVELVASFADAASAVAGIQQEKPDVVFLDVHMPSMTGFDVVAAVGAERMPFTIFVTAYEEHAVRAFDARALDYLLKPYFARERRHTDSARRAETVQHHRIR